MRRHLAAIVCADVAGYSRLMGADEIGTLASLKAHLAAIDPIVTGQGGRLVKTTGDGLLLEFASVVAAVEAAVQMQAAVAARNSAEPLTPRMQFRIGIHLGDVILNEGDIYGDGVNIAARLQELAEPDGIALSQIVAESIRGKVAATLIDAGSFNLKNIAEPVRVWRIEPTAAKAAPAVPQASLALPDKPSIAVLPFTNMSADRDQEYFADGITEDLITELSRFRSLFVIARNSTFIYKGKPVDVRQVGRDLGVRYVLEGSVRRAGDRIRVTGQLIEAETGRHLWAERYDRVLADIFDLQEEITRSIVAAIDSSIFLTEAERIARKRPDSLAEWELLTRARGLIFEVFNPRIRAEVHALADRIIAANPQCSEAFGMKALADVISVYVGHADDHEAVSRQARAWATRAREIDLWDLYAVSALGRLHINDQQPDIALQLFTGLVELHPNSSLARTSLAIALTHSGRLDASIEASELALRLNPRDPLKHVLLMNKGIALRLAGRLHDAESVFLEALTLRPRFPQACRGLVQCYVGMGRIEEAKAMMRETLKDTPALTIRSIARAGVRAASLDAFRIAGMPE